MDKLGEILKLQDLGIEIVVEKWLYLYGTGTQFALEIFPAFFKILVTIL